MDNLVLTAAHPFFHRDDLLKKAIRCAPTFFRFQLHG
jgi:V8-like Glu-specific endopeptidase